MELLDFFEEDGRVYLILEFVSGGNLFKFMSRNRKLSKELICQIFRDTVNALEFIHNRGVILRDLKPENMLLDSKNRIKSKLYMIDLNYFVILNV